MSANPTDKSQKLFVRLIAYYRPYFKIFFAGYFLLILAALSEPLIPSMMKILLDQAGKHSAGIKAETWPIWGPPLAVVGIFAGRAFLGFMSSIALGSANLKVIAHLQNDVFSRMLTSDLKLYENENTSSFINTVRSETHSASSCFTSVLQDGGRNILTALGLICYLLWLNWNLTLLVFVALPIIAIAVRKLGERMRMTHLNVQKLAEQLNYVIEENTQAHKLIRLHGAQNNQQSRFEQLSDRFRTQMTKSLIAGAAITPITQMAASVALALILSLALQQNEAGKLTVGDLAAYLTAMLMLISPLKGLGDVMPNLHRGSVALKRVFGLMDYPLEANTGAHQAVRAKGQIEYIDICKTYPGTENFAVRNIHLSIKPNQMVALVGASGSGKTTLANLIPYFMRFDSGDLRVDGISLANWDLASLRRNIAMVNQDTILLNDTVLANVCLGDLQPNTARAEKALLDAHLWQHISSLPNGLLAKIGHNGNTLSGGQRQRLAIARALYKNVPILILDEATSALDSESEHLIQIAIGKLTKSCTTLVIAHRLSTVKYADLIVVLDAGEIVERGTYSELIAKNGVFAKLVEQQFLETVPNESA